MSATLSYSVYRTISTSHQRITKYCRGHHAQYRVQESDFTLSGSWPVQLFHAVAVLKGSALCPVSRVKVKTSSHRILEDLTKRISFWAWWIMRLLRAEKIYPPSFLYTTTWCQDGRPVLAKAFQPQFNQCLWVREFIFIATGRHLKDFALSINREEYSSFVFNLNTPGKTQMPYSSFSTAV